MSPIQEPRLPAEIPKACSTCPARGKMGWRRLGLRMDQWDYLVALPGNPNTGKSTVFNALTGLRQHTGNWPGKTVTRAEGAFELEGQRYKLLDLPGTYSLYATSPDEDITRDFIQHGHPDVTVVVVDATRLERNLVLVLQVLAITGRVVVCLNLMDEARRRGWQVDARRLGRDLGVPVVPTSARQGEGLPELLRAIREVATGRWPAPPVRPAGSTQPLGAADDQERSVQALYAEANRLVTRAVARAGTASPCSWERRLDRIVTSRCWGFPIMGLLLTLVFWITIAGANLPSRGLSALFLDLIHPALRETAAAWGWPWWLRGILIDGMYLATAWVVSVMLPPMAIFFPLFALLEDFGYLPRVAFNLDAFFRRAGAHGKQALSMMMGYGCNAAGVVATRIIDSPRERLLAILTNNFALCNGRWPLQILLAGLFLGTLVPAAWAGLVAAASVMGVTLLDILLTFVVSWVLSRTLLRGEVSTFSLELPPYRPPRIGSTIVRSFLDRTVVVLGRAVVFAMPAGAIIWLIANLGWGGACLAEHLVRGFDPFGLLVGLNGVILLAYLLAIPANELVIPTVLMLTVLVQGSSGVGPGDGVMFSLESGDTMRALLQGAGWTALTAVNLMLFSLVHNPCSTTLFTIYRETGSWKWTVLAGGLPLGLGLILTFLVAQAWRWLGGG